MLLGLALSGAACSDDDDDTENTGDVPTDASELFTFLSADNYRSFAAETEVHSPNGNSPHKDVRVFVNSILEDSLKAGNSEHPVGSASVKELYEADKTTLMGWAVMVKTNAQSNGGQGWYWYEIFSTTDGSNPDFDGNGLVACIGCHATGGTDFFRTPYPLE